MAFATALLSKLPKTGWAFFGLLWRYKFWIILALVLLPTLITSVKFAIETQNPTYPFFQLSQRILTADTVIREDFKILEENPTELIGMAKPSNGIWLNFVYSWKFFWNVIYRTLGNIWLIFFPLLIIYKLLRQRNISEPAKNWMWAIVLFIIYLFVTNTIVLIHGITTGAIELIIPEGHNIWYEYFLLFKHTLPFHGLISVFKYLVINLA